MAKTSKNLGFVALFFILIISAVILAVAVSVSLSGASELLAGFTSNKSLQAFNYSEACVDEAAYQLKQDWVSVSSTLSFGRGYCIMEAVVNGSEATINSSGTAETQTESFTRIIQSVIDSNFNILSWEEPSS
ncbi:hypothetical protein KJ969_02600 [Patescibacteria group bacterium]|nr:hypothetical protein [Patescibacteria group bacterium]MBU1922373.1 hypothetical protein [Patescibacteria group bacterium]